MPPDSPLIGRTLSGRFTVTSKIGEGGFSKVYRGVQPEGYEPRDVAIKVMNAELTRDRKFVRRFRREAKAAVRLNHPSSVRLIEYGVDGECVFIVMELLVGTDLFETLVRERRLSPARAVRILMQVCEALGAAHEHGVIHRDLKPENIMLLPDASAPGGERVKVLDFGIAKILDPASDEDHSRPVDPDADDAPSSTRSALTRAGTVMGTPAYMSPEQGRAEPVDARTDLYACGVLLYQLVTGRVPFDGETALQIVMQHVHNKPTPPTEIVPGLAPALEALILKCLSKWPAQRQQSAMDLRAELAALLPSLPDGARAPAAAGPAGRLPSPALPASATERGLAPAETIVDEPPIEITTVDSGDDDDDGGATLVRDPGPPPRPLTTPARRHLVPTPTPLFVQTDGLAGALQAQTTPVGAGNTPTGAGTTPLPIPTPTVTTPGLPAPSAQPPRVVVTSAGPPSSAAKPPAPAPPRSASATTQPSMGAVVPSAARSRPPPPKPLPAAGRPAVGSAVVGVVPPTKTSAPVVVSAPAPVKALVPASPPASPVPSSATPAPSSPKLGAPTTSTGSAAAAGPAPPRVRIAGLLSLGDPNKGPARPPSVRPPAPGGPPPRPAPPRPPPPRRSAPPAPPTGAAGAGGHADGAALIEAVDMALAPTEVGLDLAPTEVALPDDGSVAIDVAGDDDLATPLAPAVSLSDRPSPPDPATELAGSRRSVPPLGAAPGPRASVPPGRVSVPPALPALDSVAASPSPAPIDVALRTDGRPSSPGAAPLERVVPPAFEPSPPAPVAPIGVACGAPPQSVLDLGPSRERISVPGPAPAVASPPPARASDGVAGLAGSPSPRPPAPPGALASSPRPPAVVEAPGPRLAPPVAMAIGIAIGVLGCGVLVVLAVLLSR